MTHPRPPPHPRGRSWRETSCPYGQGLGSRLGEMDRPTVQQVYQCRQLGATRRFHRSARTLCQRRETPSAAGDLRGVRQTEEMRSVFVRLAVTSEPSLRTMSAASITAFRVFLSVCFLSSRRSVCQHFLRHLADPGGNDRLRNSIAASLPPDRPKLRREGRVLDAAPVCGRSHLLLALTTVPHISSAASAPTSSPPPRFASTTMGTASTSWPSAASPPPNWTTGFSIAPRPNGCARAAPKSLPSALRRSGTVAATAPAPVHRAEPGSRAALPALGRANRVLADVGVRPPRAGSGAL